MEYIIYYDETDGTIVHIDSENYDFENCKKVIFDDSINDINMLFEAKIDIETEEVIPLKTVEDVENLKLINELKKAFNKYKIDVVYGLIEESVMEKIAIIAWFKLLDAIDYKCLNNIPKGVLKYVDDSIVK